ncbi:MAG: transcription termination/antitermination protein NusG [Chthoniobacterales bacterium]
MSFSRLKMTYTFAQLAILDDPRWFCLKAYPKREHLAAAQLRHQLNVECYSPRLRFRKSTQRGPVWYVEAMFPGYIFAEFVYASVGRAVIHATGVQKIVCFGEQVATVDRTVIQTLRDQTGAEEIVTIDPQLEVGNPVRIVDGPMQGIEALVTRILPAKERVRVLLEFLGRSVEMELPTPGVLSVKPVRAHFARGG